MHSGFLRMYDDADDDLKALPRIRGEIKQFIIIIDWAG